MVIFKKVILLFGLPYVPCCKKLDSLFSLQLFMKRYGNCNRLFKIVDSKRRQEHFYIFNGFISLIDLHFFFFFFFYFLVFPRLRYKGGLMWVSPGHIPATNVVRSAGWHGWWPRIKHCDQSRMWLSGMVIKCPSCPIALFWFVHLCISSFDTW